MKSGISALGDWDKAGNDKPLAKLTDRQNEGLAHLESFMEGRRTLKDVSTYYDIPSKYEMKILTLLTLWKFLSYSYWVLDTTTVKKLSHKHRQMFWVRYISLYAQRKTRRL